jgi:hypothetical protein
MPSAAWKLCDVFCIGYENGVTLRSAVSRSTLPVPGQGHIGNTSDGQAGLNMDHESAFVYGRPCDQPGCAESADA